MEDKVCLADQSFCIMCVYLTVADCVCAGAGWWSQETEAGYQAGAGGGLDDSGELRTALPRAHWEETPIRNRAVPERRPVPISPRPSWLPPSAFQRWLLPWPFFCFLLPKNIFSSSSTLLHKLVSGEKRKTWRVVLDWGQRPHLYHRERLRGECLKGGHIGKLQSPCRKKRGKHFMLPSRIYTDRYIFKKKKKTLLAVHCIENFFFKNRIVESSLKYILL